MRNKLAILTCLIVLGGAAVSTGRASACPAGQPSAPGSKLDHARSAIRQGHPKEAISLLKSWLATHPQDVMARLMLGESYAADHLPQLAEAEFKRAIKISPGSVAALLELGSFYAESGHLKSAEPLLARAVHESPHSAIARLECATVLAKLHEYRRAAAALREVRMPTARGERIAYERLRASIDNGLGNVSGAAADMEEALKLEPENAGLQFATGVTEGQAGHLSRAIGLLEPVFQDTRSPQVGLPLLEAQTGAHKDYKPTLEALRSAAGSLKDESSFRLTLAQILVHHGLYAEAAKDFARAASLEPDRADLAYDLALAQFRAGELDAALQSAKKAQSIQDSASIESLLGEIEEKRGDSLAAVHRLQQAVALSPDREAYRLSLGLELLKHQTFQAALVVFKQGTELFPKSFRMRVALGLTYYFLQDYPHAIRTLQTAAEQAQDPSLALDYLGSIQLQEVVKPEASAVKQVCSYADAHADSEKAQAYCGALHLRMAHDRGNRPTAQILQRLRKAARLDPKDSTARCELGKALDWAQQWPAARQELEVCVRLDPNSIFAHYLLSQIYGRLGKETLAMKQAQLHNDAVQRMVKANSERDRTLKKFLVTMHYSASH